MAKVLAARERAFVRRLVDEPERCRRAYVVGLLLLTLVMWFPTLFLGIDIGNPDDFYHITQAALHHRPGEVLQWFTRGYWAYSHYEYRPLTRLSLLVNWWLAGPRPWAFHLGNVLLAFLCAWLLAGAMAWAGAPVWGARLAGAVAAVFPPGKMAVAWINGRQDLLCGALLLAGVLLFFRWLRGRPWPNLAGAAACILLSALAKEPGAAAPLFLLIAVFLVPSSRALCRRLAGVVLVALPLIPYVWLRLQAWPMGEYAAQNAPQIRPFSVGVTWLFRDLVAPRVVELWRRWLPQGWTLPFDASFPQLLLEQVAFWAGLVVLAARRRRLLALGVAWEIVLFLPVHNLYWNPAFRHYRYLPRLGTAWLVGLAAWELACWAAGRMQGWRWPARWSVVGAGLVLLLWYYISQLGYPWPSWRMVRQGGPRPPATLGKSLTGPGQPSFDEKSIRGPGERR